MKSFVIRFVLAALLLLVPTHPAMAAPEGTMTWGVHVTLAARWLDPSDTEAFITPFMVLYALHDALVKPMPGNLNAPWPGRVLDDVEGRAGVGVRPSQERQVPQR